MFQWQSSNTYSVAADSTIICVDYHASYYGLVVMVYWMYVHAAAPTIASMYVFLSLRRGSNYRKLSWQCITRSCINWRHRRNLNSPSGLWLENGQSDSLYCLTGYCAIWCGLGGWFSKTTTTQPINPRNLWVSRRYKNTHKRLNFEWMMMADRGWHSFRGLSSTGNYILQGEGIELLVWLLAGWPRSVVVSWYTVLVIKRLKKEKE